MSVTDEGKMSSNQHSAGNAPGNPGAAGGQKKPGGGLAGLAAFGNMPGYKPVGQDDGSEAHTETPAVEEVVTAEAAAPAVETVPAPETPVSPEPVAAAPQAAAPAGVAPTDDALNDDGFAEQFAQDFVKEFNTQDADAAPEAQQAPVMAQEPTASPNEDAGSGGFTPEEIQRYMSQQQGEDAPQDYDALHEATAADASFGEPAAAAAPGADGGQHMQTFEAHYEQHPEIPLSELKDGQGNASDQPFFDDQQMAEDADFLGGEAATEVPDEPKERKGRKTLMAASGLIAVLALGGALAFAYKIGGESDIAKTSKPPLVQRDSTPVKVAPKDPGGKEFPHTNKKIYERLGGQKSEEVVTIKPRQEDVAAAATAAIRSGDTPSQAAPGSPRKVKTLTVRPDGTIETPSQKSKVVQAPSSGATIATAPDGTISMRFPQAAQQQATAPAAAQPKPPAAQTQASPPPVVPNIPQAPAAAPAAQTAVAAPPPAAPTRPPAPPPVQKPPAPRVAAAAPAAAAPAASAGTGSGRYVVQVAARKSQTAALAAYADVQQKYPRLLDGYGPIIKRADLGAKGVWYRLNVGPVESKSVASALCSQLKSAGMRSCIVRTQ